MTRGEMVTAAALLRLAGVHYHGSEPGDAHSLAEAVPDPDERAALLQAWRVHGGHEEGCAEPETWDLMLFLADRLESEADWPQRAQSRHQTALAL